MKILLVGDTHIYGYGLPVGQLGYPGHFIRQLSRTGRSVSVEAYNHQALPEMVAMLSRLPLNQYDLIVLQLGPDVIERVMPGSSPIKGMTSQLLPILTQSVGIDNETARPDRLLKRVKAIGKTGFDLAASIFSTVSCPGPLAQLLTLLRPYRHTVVLMTPFPNRASLAQWTRARGRIVLLEKGASQGFSVFDTETIIKPRDEYFLTGDHEHLNGVSHELIGRALFDFYQSAPTIVTVQTINRKLID
ncbi:MAG: hypothetical protein JWP57_2355 [Spirosoma sp.]|nr:hypothetical protein [Spirosoma sp.]